VTNLTILLGIMGLYAIIIAQDDRDATLGEDDTHYSTLISPHMANFCIV
jgi:hypothetical protein